MTLLILGVALFAAAHLARRLVPGVVTAMPEGIYKVVVAVLLIVSVYLMAQGYPEASAEVLWEVPIAFRHVAVVLMVLAFILFFSTHPGAMMRSRMRHPQLTGFKLWALFHLIANGDVRSLVLFGGLLIWAVLEVILINRSTGKPPLPVASENMMIAWLALPIGLAVWSGLLLSHAWIFGVSPLG